MRSYPEDKFELEEAERLKVDKWILNLLKMNPKYVFWGPYRGKGSFRISLMAFASKKGVFKRS